MQMPDQKLNYNIFKMSNNSKTQSSLSNKKQITLKSTVWIQNQIKITEEVQQPTYDNNISFRQQHRQYVIDRIKRRQEQNKRKIQQFGQSSSDQDNQGALQNQNMQKQEKVKKEVSESKEQIIMRGPSKKNEITVEDFTLQNHEKKIQKQKHSDVNKMTVFLNEKKGNSDWIKGQLFFDEKSLRVSNHECIFYDISKLKIIFTDIGDKCFKLKVNWKNQEYIFAASYSAFHCELPFSFYIFSRIINEKIKIMGKKISNFQPKPQGFPQIFIKNSFVHGKILKKSRIISKWSEIFAVINKQGLFYSKKMNQKGDLLISRTSISQFWTRFEFQGQFLIIKIFNNSSKIQLGIPVYNYMLLEGWIYHIYGLIFKNV